MNNQHIPGQISDDDEQNSLTSYQKFDKSRIHQKQEAIKRGTDLRTRRTPHRTDTSEPDDIKGFDNSSFHPDDGEPTIYNGNNHHSTAFPTSEPLRTIRITSNEKVTSKNSPNRSRPSTATSAQSVSLNRSTKTLQAVSGVTTTVSVDDDDDDDGEEIKLNEHKCTKKHDDDHLHSTKKSRRRERRKPNGQSASLNNNHHHDVLSHVDNVVSEKSTQHYQEHEIVSNECVVSPYKSTKPRDSLHHYSDSDGESERVPVKPWSPTPNNSNGPAALHFINNNNNNNNTTNNSESESPTATSPQLTYALRSLFEMITEDLDKFVYTPAPNGLGDIQCRITRDKRGMEKGLFPTYYMHVERPGDGKKFFILAGRKRRRSTTSNYLISTDATDLSRDGERFIGKLRANMLGTHFTVYDQGSNPKRNIPVEEHRRELAAIVYETNILGFKGPRKMTIIIPGMSSDHHRVEVRPRNESESLVERWKHTNMDNLLELHNKTPVWNEETQSYVLNFHGRVTQASVKNFQVVHEDDQDYVCMQFGRVSDGSLILPPLAVWIARDKMCSGTVALNILLTILGVVPGTIHAWFVICCCNDL
ncbi:unnamed protein product [Adineta steineri]|uniref:Tubby C-terminal domain-containing protein n=1 Tax=Adineta steineri TaxID=433720 RepID=A0A814LET0_9BILA|nr:unnamed protein product [Adineta steineri]